MASTTGEAEPADVIRVERIAPDGELSFLPRWRAPSTPRWALALSGGAALGIAHLGVLRELEDDGLVPDMIAGTSAGAMVGGLYASGYQPSTIERVFRDKNWNSIFRQTRRTRGITARRDPLGPALSLSQWGRHADGKPLQWRGMVPDWEIYREFVRFYGRTSALTGGDLDRMPIPFRAVACDLEADEVYAPRHAPLPLITRASIGLPIFGPVEMDGRVLVDGGVIENTPVPTARAMGAEFVVAVVFRTSVDHQVKGLMGMIGRSKQVAFDAQRRGAIESADVLVNVKTGTIDSTDFHRTVDELIQAGHEAWAADREAVLESFEGLDGMRWYDVRSIETDDHAPPRLARKLSSRLSLDGATRRVSALRLELELIRLLRSGRYDDAWFTVQPDGRLRLSLERAERVARLTLELPPELEPTVGTLRALPPGELAPVAVIRAVEDVLIDARLAGFFLAGISEVAWDRDTETLLVRVDAGTLTSIGLVADNGESLPLRRALRRLEGRPAKLHDLERAIDMMSEAGSLWRAGSALTRSPGGYELRLGLKEPPRWMASWNAGFADTIGLAVMARLLWPADIASRGWGTELRGGVSREAAALGLEVRPAWDSRLVPYARVGAAAPGLRFFDRKGNPQDWRYFATGIASAGVRSQPTRLGQIELGPKLRWTSGKALLPERDDSEHDLSLELSWFGDLRSDPRLPRGGLAWLVGGAVPLAGDDRPWLAYLDASATVRLGRRSGLSLLVRAAEVGDDHILPADRWDDAGSFWEAPGLDAGRGRAREVRRATLALRRELGELFGINVTAGVSGGRWRLSEQRLDRFIPDDGHGTSVFVEASTARFGPVTLGLMFSELEGNKIFFTVNPDRIPWTGPIRPREGAIVP